MVAEPFDETYDIDSATESLASIVERVRRSGRRATLTRAEQPVAAIVTLDNDKAIGERRAREEAALDRITAAFADVDFEEVERQVAQAVRDVRSADDR